MATENRSKDTQRRALEYIQCPWGDLVYGTKAELQSIGIGKEMAFPGEPDGPRWRLNVRDPRGFATEVKHHSDDIYSASISFPGRERAPTQQTTVAPGVKKRLYHWFDEYVGAAEALVAAGLVRGDQFPGQPGMRKMRVTIFPDGTIPTGASTANHKQSRLPGSKQIERQSKTTYMVRIFVGNEEASRREEVKRRADLEYEARIRALPRPAPLAAPLQECPAQDIAPILQDCLLAIRNDIGTFEVGAHALLDGGTVEIVREYGVVNVKTRGLQMGYVVKNDGGEIFAPAHRLRLCDGGISHLKLVKG